jgi:hypothetical protein
MHWFATTHPDQALQPGKTAAFVEVDQEEKVGAAPQAGQ